MRAIAIFAVAFSFAAAAAGPPTKSVDLDRPGVLDAIQRQDQPLYDRITALLKVAEIEPCDTLPRIVKTQLHVDLETCNGYAILTSFPAKIRVTFRIDDTVYASNVIQPKITAEARPVAAGPGTEKR